MNKSSCSQGILRILRAAAIAALISGVFCIPILASFKIQPEAGKVYTYQAPVTATYLSALPGSSAYGESVTFTATVTGEAETPTGSVDFSIDGSWAGGETLFEGVASLVIDSLSVGNHSIVASFSGSDAYEGSTSISSPLSYTVNPKALTVSGIIANNKEYNGTRTANLDTSSAILVGVLGSDDVILNTSSASGLFADKNVGPNKPVTISGLSLNGSTASNYTLAPPAATASITARSLTVTATGTNRVYNRTTGATVTLSDNRINGDVLTVNYSSASFSNKNVGTGKPINVIGISISGADSGNYSLSSTTCTATGNITAKSLTVTATGTNRVYNGTTSATVTLSDNRISGDVLTVNYSSASFSNKNVGTGKPINVSGISISGADSGNYSLSSTTCTATGNITTKTLTATATGVNKVYDGSSAATVNLSDNRIAGDVLNISYSSAVFANKNAGTGKTINVSGISKSGIDAANYALSGTSTSTTASITPRLLSISAAGDDKIYDGTTDASGSLNDDRISGDVIATTSTSAAFVDKNVGNSKMINIAGITKSGTDSGNYMLANTECTATANITAKDMTVTAIGTDKVYDGTTAAIATLSDDRISGDVLTVSYGSAVFANANAGNGKTVTVSGLVITGADAVNYDLTAAEVYTTANITRATPNFNSLISPTIDEGTAATALSGNIKSGMLTPTGQVSISIRLSADNIITQTSGINADNGAFSSSFETADFAAGAYTILYGYSGDNNFYPLSDALNTATLTVQTVDSGGGGNTGGGGTGGGGGGSVGGGSGGGGGASSVNSILTLKGLISNAGNPVVNAAGIVQDNVQLRSNDGSITLTMTQGTELKDASGKALTSMSATKNQVLNAPVDGVIVLAYDFGPDGAKFNPALILIITYDPAALPRGIEESSLFIAYWDGFKWAPLTATANIPNHSLTAGISHFTVYALIGHLAPVNPTLTPLPTQTPAASPSPAPSTASTPAPAHETSPAANLTITPTPSVLPSSLPVIPALPAVQPDVTKGTDLITTPPAEKPNAPFSMMFLIYICVFVIAMVVTIMIVLRRRGG